MARLKNEKKYIDSGIKRLFGLRQHIGYFAILGFHLSHRLNVLNRNEYLLVDFYKLFELTFNKVK